MVGVEQWAEMRRLHFVRGLSIREIHRRTGLHRDTIRRAISSDEPPVYRRARAGRSSIRSRTRSTGCFAQDPKLPGQRIRELIAPLGFDGGKTIVDDYLREVRPLFLRRRGRFSGRSIGRGDLPVRSVGAARGDPGRSRPDPPGLGRRRVPGLLARWRRRAGLLQADPGPAGRDPSLSVVARRAAGDAGLGPPGRAARHGGRPTDGVRRVLRRARVDWHFCEPATRRPRASSSACRTSWSARSSRAAPSPTSSTSSSSSTRGSTAREPADAQDAARPADRPARRGARGDGAAARGPARHGSPLGAAGPARSATCASTPATTRSTRRWSAGASRSASPSARSSAVALDTGELACRHPRSFARHRTITALEHARTLKTRRVERRGAEPVVEVRSLARYDALIA